MIISMVAKSKCLSVYQWRTGEDMSYIMVDVEADDPIPGDYSMVCFRAIVVAPSLGRTFYGQLKPISEEWIREALEVSGFTRETL